MSNCRCNICDEAHTLDRAGELSDAHWEYIRSLLVLHAVTDEEVERIGWHYRAALVHGYGHGMEDAGKEAAQ